MLSQNVMCKPHLLQAEPSKFSEKLVTTDSPFHLPRSAVLHVIPGVGKCFLLSKQHR